ncbi:universal stress protein [Pseudomonas sp. MAFF212428]|uniref:Universal stress protein n=1 Tax=Pseudomonas brassicae TaxID=2708063 RepID=A0A6B3NVL3_9PSED|nr:universal stress protein [Pseudomonas brassicae]NER65843.1 universal stress protein [Pseudomonas brassicae]
MSRGAIAKASGAALHITVFIEDPDLFGVQGKQVALQALAAQNRQWLQDEIEQLQGSALVVTSEIAITRTVLDEVLQHIEQLHPDLVFKDVHHESALKRVFVTPLDWHLLRECAVAVHLVSEIRSPLPRVVVAAVDPSQAHAAINQQIIQAANALAIQCDAELHLLHGFDTANTHLADFGAGAVTMPGFSSEVRRSLQLNFDHLADALGVPAQRQHFLAGSPTRVIAAFAQHHRADVIVMGNTHRHGLVRLVGSTTEQVLYQVPCNVLAVKGD